MRGSPAEHAGIEVGDRFCTINGKRVTADTEDQPLAHWSRELVGKRVELGLCDGRSLTLVLKEFY